MKRKNRLPLPLRMIGGILAVTQIFMGTPVRVCAGVVTSGPATSVAHRQSSTGKAAENVRVNRTVPETTAPTEFPQFSIEPTDAEISKARVFEEPLIPVDSQRDKAENLALSTAISDYLHRGSSDDDSAMTQFLSTYPESRWRGSILLNLGIVYRLTGYFSKALESWNEAWNLLKNETEPQTRALADRASAELLELNARVGRYQTLKLLLQEVQRREILGSADEKISRAREGLWMMENKPEVSFLCGPAALSNVFAATHDASSQPAPAVLRDARSSVNGFSLAQLQVLANEAGMKFQMAKRQPATAVPIPCMVNWKIGHYAALVKEDHGHYLVKDPTFAYDIWISPAALDAECSGYFLVGAGRLPAGWESVSADEGKGIWGKGFLGDANHDTPNDRKCKDNPCPPKQGMAQYNFHALVMSLNIWDSPVGYTPPRGPSMNFKVTYNQREANQPANFTFSDLGQKWTHDWLSYVQENPNPPSSVKVIIGGGGAEPYTYNGQTYNVQRDSGTILTRFTSPSLHYERQYPDGSKDVFGLSDGANPPKIFLTQRIDSAGNSITFTYDDCLRLVAATDALGQVTTFSYELGGQCGQTDYLLITKVTDPFGRFARFDYTPSAPRQLVRITDVMGMTSEFTYVGNFITSMTTPYGSTTFSWGEYGEYRWLEAIDPIGAKERAEVHYDSINQTPDSEPVAPTGLNLHNSDLRSRNTFYWDKKAMLDAPGDYTKARIWHWVYGQLYGTISSILESEKKPVENRVWYNYPGQTSATSDSGVTLGLPSKAARVMDDGKTQLWQYTYTTTGLPTTVAQPALDGNGTPVAGRRLAYDYDPANGVDLQRVRQTTGNNNETVLQLANYSQHRPQTVTDVAARVATYTYNSYGQVLTETRTRNGNQETTTWAYDPNGYLMSVTGPLPGASVSFTYDGYGRVRTIADSAGYTLTYDYDSLDRVTTVTFPDGTSEQTIWNRLDPEQHRDRLGRWSYTWYDALRHPAAFYDPLGRVTWYDWCACGALNSIMDGLGHKTSFTRDLEYRLTAKTYDNQSSLAYAYENTTSRLKSITDAKGQVTNYEYYIDNNLKQISYTGSNPPTPTVNFTYDPNYNRAASMTDGNGPTNYAYVPVGTLGALRLASVDGPLANDTITYGYDEYSRVNSRSINGGANATSTEYDPIGRVSSATNPLGAFNYVYVNATPRLDHANYPNGQVAQYAYFPNTGDQRLQEIWNKTSTGATISKFDYSYNAFGDILSWSQQTDANTPFVHSFDYDPIDQLLNDTVALNGTTQHQYSYAYDWGGNRTAEQIDSTVSPATYNNLNQLTNRGGNGQAIFEGALDKPGTVTIGDGSPGVTDASNHFRVMASIVAGSNLLPITAVDAYGNTKGQHVQWTVNGNGSQALTYDSVGNLTSDGSRIYEWDAANRCIAINQGTHRTEMTYDGFSREVKRVEKENGTIVSTKQFIWCALQRCEERDASNQVSKRFYSQGEQIGGSAYFYNRDHLGSIRELTDGNRIVRARYDYDPYGRRTKLSGDLDADFGFTGHYISSQYLDLAFAPFRIYGADLGRWISRDPIGEAGGINLYGYVQNEPINRIDDLGLASIYTDQIDGVTYFNPNPEMPGPIFSWPSRSDVVPGSLPGAGGPYDSADVYPAEGPLHNNPRAYGPNDALLTDDPRGRWLHGGGSGLDNPLAPRQGWYPTHGCTRMQNDDIQDLVDKVRDFKEKNPGIPVPYSRSRPPVGDFGRGFGGAFRNFA